MTNVHQINPVSTYFSAQIGTIVQPDYLLNALKKQNNKNPPMHINLLVQLIGHGGCFVST